MMSDWPLIGEVWEWKPCVEQLEFFEGWSYPAMSAIDIDGLTTYLDKYGSVNALVEGEESSDLQSLKDYIYKYSPLSLVVGFKEASDA